MHTLIIGLLSACGGGSGGEGDNRAPEPASNPPQASIDQWQAGIYPSSNLFAARCELPRTGSNSQGLAFIDQQGTANTEKMWLRSWSHETYLWYQDLPDLNPLTFSVPEYFDVLKTDARTNSGKLLDQFHFSQDTQEYEQQTQSGVVGGFGVRLGLVNPVAPSLVVLFTEPNSPATNASTPLLRGARILTVNGEPAFSPDTGFNSALFSRSLGQNLTIEFQNPGETESTTVSLSSAPVVTSPVQNARVVENGDSKVGYVLFNSHITTSEPALVDAFSTFEQEGIDELVLDLRYNGGGSLFIASQLAYMIAGEGASADRDFARIMGNDKQTSISIPFINDWLSPESGEFVSLPSVSLPRVFILSSGRTCSASEAIINGLQGIGVEVVQIGSTTCGKPFGFLPQDNCGTTYFTVQFETANDLGFSGYADGFSPQNQLGSFGISLPGCFVVDDTSRPLGDPQEASFATALNYMNEGVCQTASSLNGLNSKPTAAINEEIEVLGLMPSESVAVYDF